MIPSVYERLHITPGVSAVIVSLALMLIAGFAMTRLTSKLRLPNVTAYIVSGILLGPFCLDLVPRGVIDGMSFLADIALAFIAFSTGEFFRISTLKKSGTKVLVITVLEACLASALVFLVCYFPLGLDLNFSLVLGALAAATAPASTVMTIRQTGAKGDFVDTLLQVVALDDAVGLVAYSVAISVAVAADTGSFDLLSVLRPLGVNLLVFCLGGVFGLLLKLFLDGRSADNRLIVSVALLFAFCGICTALDVSPLLGCMAMGMVYINTTGDERLFKQLNYFSPPILLLFFVRSGLNFDLGALVNTSDAIGGAFSGCLLTGKDKRVRNYLGLALIPQAGVAIGLAAMGARTLGGSAGTALETIILSSSVLYELIGPACAKLSLYLSHSYSNRLEDLTPEPEPDETGCPKSEVERLIERINAIQTELPAHRAVYYEDEKAFSDAAEEHYAALYRALPAERRKR